MSDVKVVVGRLYTEDVGRDSIVAAVREEYDGFTLYPTVGYWKGIEERSVMVEVIAPVWEGITEVRHSMTRIAKAIKVANNQQAVLITYGYVETEEV